MRPPDIPEYSRETAALEVKFLTPKGENLLLQTGEFI